MRGAGICGQLSLDFWASPEYRVARQTISEQSLIVLQGTEVYSCRGPLNDRIEQLGPTIARHGINPLTAIPLAQTLQTRATTDDGSLANHSPQHRIAILDDFGFMLHQPLR